LIVKRLTVTGILILVGLGSLPTATARTWLVPSEAPTIQAGIDSAAVNDTVQVECGTYWEHGLVMKPGVTLRSEAGSADCVIVNGWGQGRILDCVDLSDPVVVEGITFSSGKVTEGWIDALGGGIRCRNSQITVINCRFRDNSARIGGGLGILESVVTLRNNEFIANAAGHPDFAAGGGIWIKDSAGSVANSVFVGNTAFSDDLPGDGGGFSTITSDLIVSDCTFIDNSAGAGAGGFYSVNFDSSLVSNCTFSENTANWGAGVYLEESFAQLTDCTFTKNIGETGGAMLIGRESSPVIRRCHFEANEATLHSGGAIDCWQSTPVIEQCSFVGNSAFVHGGAINFGDSYPQLIGCVLSSNTATGNGGAIRCHYARVQLTSCTLVANAGASGGGIYCGGESSATIHASIIAFSTEGESAVGATEEAIQITCSDFFGNIGGDWVGYIADQEELHDNLAADPRFCSITEGDYHLAANSPCGPDSSSVCGLIGALGIGCGLVAVPEEANDIPLHFQLEQNYPNPFNPLTTIRFSLAESNLTTVCIFDTVGRRIRTLLAEHLPARTHEITWNGRDDSGHPVAAGIYFYQVISAGHEATGRMALVK